MQATRELILQYLKENGEATVDELANLLDLTSVTVRHHLDVLRGADLVADPVIRHRSSPGRPQYLYTLTKKASAYFPKNYCDLAANVIAEFKATTTPEAVHVFFLTVANRMTALAPPLVPGEAMTDRLDRAVAFLNGQGYVASWQRTTEGYLLHTNNCPYEALAGQNPELCSMDLGLASNLLGMVPQRVSRLVEGATSCAYFVPYARVPAATLLEAAV